MAEMAGGKSKGRAGTSTTSLRISQTVEVSKLEEKSTKWQDSRNFVRRLVRFTETAPRVCDTRLRRKSARCKAAKSAAMAFQGTIPTLDWSGNDEASREGGVAHVHMGSVVEHVVRRPPANARGPAGMATVRGPVALRRGRRGP